jgi:glycerol-3-phosphate dehydrogenase subunit C
VREGSLEAPTRHPLEWRSDAFYDFAKIEEEMERVFDICHGCRRCFNLCDSFPRLFDLVDDSPTSELDGVKKADYKQVVDACTLCDMCFLTKCPYVPPHAFNLDFPHLILRYRAAELKRDGKTGEGMSRALAETDRNGRIAKPLAGLANWASDVGNDFTRPILEKVAGVARDAVLPKYHTLTLEDLAAAPFPPNPQGPSYAKRKAVVYATCFVDYNTPDTGYAALKVLANQGVEARVVYPTCCGMPQLEHGDIAEVARRAETVSREFARWIGEGYDVVSLTASCSLMMKFEWPLILPENKDVKQLSRATRDISEYVVELAKADGLAPGLSPVKGGVSVHHACHARAQNMGAKSAEMLKLIPDTKVDLVERCSGHGGTFGVMKSTRPLAKKVGKPAARQLAQKGNDTVCSDCPLACNHLGLLMTTEISGAAAPKTAHPIQVFAEAYGLV